MTGLPVNVGRRLSGVGAAALCVVLLGGCSKPAAVAPSASHVPAADPDVVARVGDAVIRRQDLEAEAQRLVRQRRAVPAKDALLESLVARAAMLQRAHTSGVADDPAVRHDLEGLLIDRLRQKELTATVDAATVSDEEVRAAYDAEKIRYTQPARVRLAALSMAKSPVMSQARRAELRARMEEARARAVAAPATGGRGPAAGGFGSLAIEYSEDQVGRYRGGDIGWLDPAALPPHWPAAVLQAGCALEKGVVSPVIEDAAGLYLVMKTDSRESVVTPFEKVAATLRQSLLVKKQQELARAFVEESVRRAAPQLYPEALSTVSLPVFDPELAGRSDATPPQAPGM